MIKIEIPKKAINAAYLPYLEDDTRTQIIFGGSSSGKSKFKAQQAIYRLLAGGRNFLVCRQVGRTIRGSVAQELSKVIREWKLSHLFQINKTDGTITCENGYQVIFAGLDDVEKLKSITPAKGVITDIWVEEATEADQPTIKQLMKRQRGGSDKVRKTLTLTFNPIYQTHWIFTTYFAPIGWTDEQTVYKSHELLILKTTYKDNQFLTDDDIRDLESETDKYFYSVYTLGNWGVLGNVIFTNWTIANLNDPTGAHYLPESQRTNPRDGLDFGYAKDPAAWLGSHYDKTRKTIYIYDELYQTGLTNDMLADALKDKNIGNRRVVCDSAEPKSIAELRKFGINARGAKKGKDSINFGIQWLQRQNIVLDIKCINGANELRLYKWKEDAGGNVVSPPVPVDRFNHLIDGGLRYAYEDDMTEKEIPKARSWKG